MQQFLLLVSLSACVSHDLLTLFLNHSSPSVTPMCLAICQDVFGTEPFFPLVWRVTSCPPYTKYGHLPQLTDLSCEVKYFRSAEKYTIFHANISGAIRCQFFLVKSTAKWTDPKALAVMITSSDSESTRRNVGTPNLGRWLQGTAGAVQEFIFCLEPKALVTLYVHI